MEHIVIVNMSDTQIMGKLVFTDDNEIKLTDPVYVSARLSSSGFDLNMQRITLFSEPGEEHIITIDKNNIFTDYSPSETMIDYYEFIIKSFRDEYDELFNKQLINKQKQLTIYNNSSEDLLEHFKQIKEMLEMSESEPTSNTVFH